MAPISFQMIRSGIKALGAVSPSIAGQVAAQIFTSPRRHQRPKWETELMASGRPLRLRSKLAAHVWGEGQKTVLLVHGWEGRGTQLGRLVEPLVEHGFRVIALDGPAHGDSPGRRTNIRFYANALKEVVDELGHLHAIVAHSFGAGATTIGLSEGMPVSRVILVASPSHLAWVIDDFCQMMELSEPLSGALRSYLERWSGVRAADINIAALSEQLNVTALIVHDPKDREVPFVNAEDLARSWPGAKLLPLENVGHRRILKSPHFVQAAIEFIRKDPLAREASVL